MFRNKITCRKLLPTAAILLAFAATASAADAATLDLGTPSLTGRVAITEPVTVTCSAFDPSLTLFQEIVNVQVEQAAGKGIARGSGVKGGGFTALLFSCDGTENTIPVNISADPAGPPFHGGQAVFTASVQASAGTPCFPGSTTCITSPITTQSATAGPTALHIH